MKPTLKVTISFDGFTCESELFDLQGDLAEAAESLARGMIMAAEACAEEEDDGWTPERN